MPEGNESPPEELKEARVKMPNRLRENLNAMKSQMNATVDAKITRDRLINYILEEYVSENWDGQVPYEEKKKIIEFVQSGGARL